MTVRVVYVDRIEPLPGTTVIPWGLYDSTARTVYVQRNLTRRDRDGVLAHELCHAEREHRGDLDPALVARQEAWADTESARRLIPLEQLRRAARAYPDDPAMLADELDVAEWVLLNRCDCLTPAERAGLTDEGDVA